MKPQVLRLSNFRSFVGAHSFRFACSSGLFFLTAENREDEDLGANGGGKTTLWEGLCWCLYGKTSRGVKAGDLLSWDAASPGYSVELDFLSSGRSCRLRRTWNPNSLQLSRDLDSNEALQDVQQEDVDAFLGLSFESFLQAVFISQTAPMFLDLGAADKALILSSVLRLDRWLEFSARAGQLAKQSRDEQQKLLSELARVEGAIESLRAADWTVRILGFKREQEKRCNELEEQISRTDTESMLASRELARESAELQGLLNSRSEAVHTRDEAQVLEQDCQRRVSSLRAELSALIAKREMPGEQLSFLAKSDHCPFCLQSISERHAREESARLQVFLSTSRQEEQRIRAELDKISGIQQQHRAALDAAKGLLDDITTELLQRRERIARLESQTAAYERERMSLQGMLRAEAAKPNIYEQERDKQLLTSCKLKARRILLKERASEQEVRTESLEFWSKRFKDVRLFLISEALARFELEANNSLDFLGLSGWRMRFDVDSETKSGTIRRGFSVLIQTPRVDRPVPWEVWSGGESQRLRIAAQIGLSNLILDSLGASSSIEVWDEPSRWLSEIGIEDLLQTLQRRAEITGKEIWVVDHRSLQFGGFSNTLTIVKDENGSRIQNQMAPVPRVVPVRRALANSAADAGSCSDKRPITVERTGC